MSARSRSRIGRCSYGGGNGGGQTSTRMRMRMRALKINVLVNGRHGWVGRDGWTEGQARADRGRTDALFNASLVSQRIGRSSPSPPVYLQRGKREREDDITSARKVAMRRFDSLLSSFTATNVCRYVYQLQQISRLRVTFRGLDMTLLA